IALGGLERKQDAVAAAETALECDPEEPAAHEVLADALLAVGRRDRARTVAQTGLELDPHRDGLAITLGDIALSLGQGREAERYFRHVLQHDPENAGVLANLGVALRAQGREGDAARAFEAAARLDPHASFARERLTDGPAAMFGSGRDAALPALLLVVFAAYAISTGSLALVLIVAAVIATLAGVVVHQRRARWEALSPAGREVLARQPWWRR
ncbi:MAG TPA: tetratricopeptide repeat protein, partial [Solirubrobacteraceae bacterium]|nr:tetratricopeptide repeat protein [Solirubrobacteraceae bacterium]